MGKAMTKSQIADHLAKKADITKKTATQILDDFATLAYKEAKNAFVVPGIGKLVLHIAKPEWVGILKPARPLKFLPKKWSSSA